MSHKTEDFHIHQGDTLSIPITVTQNGEAGGAVIDLTDCTVTFALATTASTPVRAVTKTVGDGIELTTPGAGLMTITLLPADTQELIGIYQYQVRVTDPSDNKTTVITGIVTIDRSILEVDE